MFEQELEMEQRQSSVVPLLLIIAMIMAFVGVAGYYVVQNRKSASRSGGERSDRIVAEAGRPRHISIQGGPRDRECAGPAA